MSGRGNSQFRKLVTCVVSPTPSRFWHVGAVGTGDGNCWHCWHCCGAGRLRLRPEAADSTTVCKDSDGPTADTYGRPSLAIDRGTEPNGSRAQLYLWVKPYRQLPPSRFFDRNIHWAQQSSRNRSLHHPYCLQAMTP